MSDSNHLPSPPPETKYLKYQSTDSIKAPMLIDSQNTCHSPNDTLLHYYIIKEH